MINSPNSLAGGSVLVVGGARGLGAAVVRGLVGVGAQVAVIDHESDAVEGLDVTAGVALVRADLRDQQALAKAYEEVDQLLPPPRAVINAVALPSGDEASVEMTESTWRGQVDVNLTGIFWSCQQAGQRMLRRGGGSIVNFSSLSGIQVSRTHRSAPYHAAKAGVNALTRALAAEWGDRGIRVNAVAPGAFVGGAPAGLHGGDEERRRQDDARLATSVPLRRLGVPDELVATVLFLASDDSSYTTGETLVVDGGRVVEID